MIDAIVYKSFLSRPENVTVWVDTRGHQAPGRILHAADTPRSYLVETLKAQVRRNRILLRL